VVQFDAQLISRLDILGRFGDKNYAKNGAVSMLIADYVNVNVIKGSFESDAAFLCEMELMELQKFIK
jgi:hypothetical protein